MMRRNYRRSMKHCMTLRTGYLYHQETQSQNGRAPLSLFIIDLPVTVSVDDLRRRLRGYCTACGLGERKHRVGIGLTDAPPQVQEDWRSGDIRIVRWQDLITS